VFPGSNVSKFSANQRVVARVGLLPIRVNAVSRLRTYGAAWVSWLIGERDTGLGFFGKGSVGSMMVVEVLIAVEDGLS
jgi:hypothetical protein